eukprot:CAMPEP_0194320050 /NCGR_PEP_ID=MMETSP0171-20130528/16435_1 /TAXON_ID=218684 /ORGANISM="Corethron pennatum, Strain L29A3" /LENGTH=405 /DNA_ID=CAMNT_0039077479 /DNA_START=88 /DNA_END=1305 /DNA_ORIENTATION=+
MPAPATCELSDSANPQSPGAPPLPPSSAPASPRTPARRHARSRPPVSSRGRSRPGLPRVARLHRPPVPACLPAPADSALVRHSSENYLEGLEDCLRALRLEVKDGTLAECPPETPPRAPSPRAKEMPCAPETGTEERRHSSGGDSKSVLRRLRSKLVRHRSESSLTSTEEKEEKEEKGERRGRRLRKLVAKGARKLGAHSSRRSPSPAPLSSPVSVALGPARRRRGLSVDDGADPRRRRQMERQSRSSARSVTAVRTRWGGEASPTTITPEEAAARRRRAAAVAAERERERARQYEEEKAARQVDWYAHQAERSVGAAPRHSPADGASTGAGSVASESPDEESRMDLLFYGSSLLMRAFEEDRRKPTMGNSPLVGKSLFAPHGRGHVDRENPSTEKMLPDTAAEI